METKKPIKKVIKKEEIVKELEPIILTERQLLEIDIVNFIDGMIGKTYMRSEEAQTFCNLYNKWLYKDVRTSDCNPTCSECMIRQYPKLKEVWTNYKNK